MQNQQTAEPALHFAGDEHNPPYKILTAAEMQAEVRALDEAMRKFEADFNRLFNRKQ